MNSMFMFSVVPIFMGIIFIIMIVTLISRAAKFGVDKSKPIMPIRSKVISKRTNVWGEHSHTSYYATFEFENGERMELSIPHDKIGFIVEGDTGILEFQGSIFVNFTRG